jgi:hypothetical protein
MPKKDSLGVPFFTIVTILIVSDLYVGQHNEALINNQ